ncbi:MAG TPA: hypothetical protein VFJ74_00975 [Gemmatimonadaceae bacterium]|nr:hypothetical protein [Gemmatimonadaceae bacterium]
MPDAHRDHPLAAHYDALWETTAPAVREGRVSLDPWPTRKHDDPRRGLTLLGRPAPAVASRLVALLDELREIEPDQYYQPRADLHLTVLSLFSATADHEQHAARIDDYRDAVAEALDGAPPFAVDTIGVTLAPGAVIAQGFPRGDALDHLRARLRRVATAHGLGDTLDQRYLLKTAHSTLVRFVAPLRDPGRFVNAVAAARRRDFGTSTVTRLELTLADWYQSTELARPVGEFTLGTSPPDAPADG